MYFFHISSSEGIEVNPRKIEGVKNCPRPLTPTNIRSFFCLNWYYRRSVNGIVSIASPLTTLTQKIVRYENVETCERSLQVLKYRLISVPQMTLLDHRMGFVVYCDTSQVGLGCVVMQHGKLVAYSSRKIKVHQKN